ncbi:uncharacterized protein C22orf31 [Haplochromis burtoni]|uniref:uncharacterized protein C22orf31 n=1 Tax=Haplochromis burtoni TaxID=8153 RepID=UPI001C2DECA9|nr:uncharacterized protein C22orf31 [Haplochromis burtoni]
MSRRKATQQPSSIMENLTVPDHFKDHNYCKRNTACQARDAKKPRASRKQPCCSKDQVVNSTQRPRRRDRTVSQPRKRKRSPASRLSRPPKTSVPPSAIAHDDLPVAKKLPPRPEPCSTNHQPTSSSDSPLKIYNLSVEDYQRVYHEVVDSRLTSKNGRKRPYSLELGRSLKQNLWERLNRPMVETSTNEDGLEEIDFMYGQKVKIPHFDISC